MTQQEKAQKLEATLIDFAQKHRLHFHKDISEMGVIHLQIEVYIAPDLSTEEE